MAIPGELIVTSDVPAAFAQQTIDAFRTRSLDTFSIALSGGGTARRCYEHLAEVCGTQIDWWKVDVYWGDERCVPHDHVDSNYRLAREALLDRVGAANATHLMRCAEGPDPYQLRLGDLGRIDLVHLGMGADGHTASLFPESAALDADPGRLVGTWQQDRASDGGARALASAVSVDGGRSWQRALHPMSRCGGAAAGPAGRVEGAAGAAVAAGATQD